MSEKIEQAPFFLKAHIGALQSLASAGYQPDAMERIETMGDFVESVNPAGEEIGEGMFWFEKAEENVGVGAADIEIDHAYPPTLSGKE